jgi:hypothetical protein
MNRRSVDPASAVTTHISVSNAPPELGTLAGNANDSASCGN